MIGNMSLPCGQGRTSGSVSIKGDYGAIRDYPLAIRRAVRNVAVSVRGKGISFNTRFYSEVGKASRFTMSMGGCPLGPGT
jgi:hypothetical protein